IWIDAMCINQGDDKEKMGQIQMMTDIYRNAKKVMIWLGEEIPETQTTVEQIQNVSVTLKAINSSTPDVDSVITSVFH
ncbi:heterokaryon incompatibility, partial [Setomelanomma holmii]